jgi:hypothetical protein
VACERLRPDGRLSTCEERACRRAGRRLTERRRRDPRNHLHVDSDDARPHPSGRERPYARGLAQTRHPRDASALAPTPTQRASPRQAPTQTRLQTAAREDVAAHVQRIAAPGQSLSRRSRFGLPRRGPQKTVTGLRRSRGWRRRGYGGSTAWMRLATVAAGAPADTHQVRSPTTPSATTPRSLWDACTTAFVRAEVAVDHTGSVGAPVPA